MAYMKKNVNFGLFFLIIATLICLLAFTLYYNEKFYKLDSDYKKKTEEVNNLLATLTIEKTKLNKTSVELLTKTEREQDLSTKYNVLLQEKQSLQTQLESTISQLNQKKAELAATESELSATKSQLSTAQAEIATKTAQINNLYSELNELDQQKASICASLVAVGGSSEYC